MPGKKLTFEVNQLIYYNHQLGKSASELAEMFSVSRKTIYNVLHRAENEGRLEPKSGGGRKLKIGKHVDRVIMRKLDRNPQISVRPLLRSLKKSVTSMFHTKRYGKA